MLRAPYGLAQPLCHYESQSLLLFTGWLSPGRFHRVAFHRVGFTGSVSQGLYLRGSLRVDLSTTSRWLFLSFWTFPESINLSTGGGGDAARGGGRRGGDGAVAPRASALLSGLGRRPCRRTGASGRPSVAPQALIRPLKIKNEKD